MTILPDYEDRNASACRLCFPGHNRGDLRSPAKRPLNIVDVSLNKRSVNIVHAGVNKRAMNTVEACFNSGGFPS
jgi:hypothetical protein